MVWLLVALGGSLGAMGRYALALWLGGNPTGAFPVATFTANVVGSFLMGVAFILIVERGLLPAEWRYFFMVGMLGAFTTFSTFSIESISLIQYHSLQSAAIYIFSSVIASLGAVFIGVFLTEKLF